MEINHEIAREVVVFIHRKTGYHSIVCDRTATIIADSAGTRVGVVHAGAKRILSGGVEIYRVTAEEAAASGGSMKEGFSLAVHDERGAKIGTFGIGGPLAVVEPVAAVAADLVMSKLVNLARDQDVKVAIQDVSRQITRTLQQGTEQVGKLRAMAQEFADASATLAGASDASAEHVRHIGSILGLIRKVAAQTRMLGLNAAVEAARAGEHGRGFAVVADGVRRLSDESSQSVDEIGEILVKFQGSFDAVIGRAKDGRRLTVEQSRAMDDMLRLMDELREVGNRLAALAERL